MSGAALSILYGVFGGALLLLLYERASAVARAIVRISSWLVPKSQRMDRREQWEADLGRVDGEMWKLAFAIGILAFSTTIHSKSEARRLWSKARAKGLLGMVAKVELLAVGYSGAVVNVVRFSFHKKHPIIVKQGGCAYATVFVLPTTSRLGRNLIRYAVAFDHGVELHYISVKDYPKELCSNAGDLRFLKPST